MSHFAVANAAFGMVICSERANDKFSIVTPENTAAPTTAGFSSPPPQAPSTAGMTTKVVKGSAWTLAGQIVPMAVALVATPFTIRFLGSEGYGVLILIGLIPTYFAFADFGMGVASTRFASEAYSKGEDEEEAAIVGTVATAALLTSLAVAVPIFLFSSVLVRQFNVPEYLQSAASVALKITSVSFVVGILSSVLNTPMLARLRMDLNSIANTLPRVLLAVGTPLVLYFGGGRWPTKSFTGFTLSLEFLFWSEATPEVPMRQVMIAFLENGVKL